MTIISTRKCDVSIICALPIEAESFKIALSNESPSVKIEKKTDRELRIEYEIAELKNNQGSPLRLMISCMPEMGMERAMSHISSVIIKYQPLFIGMCGICAGNKDETNLGDLIVALKACSYKPATINNSSQKYDLETESPNQSIISFVKDREKSNYNKLIQIPCHLGTIASCGAVRKDNPFGEIKGPVKSVIGVDLEALAIYKQANTYSGGQALVVKGVCDYADENKNDDIHEKAATRSAKYLVEFVKEYVTTNHFPDIRNGGESDDIPNIPNIPILCFTGTKGGVGKTTIARRFCELIHGSMSNLSVLYIDLDVFNLGAKILYKLKNSKTFHDYIKNKETDIVELHCVTDDKQKNNYLYVLPSAHYNTYAEEANSIANSIGYEKLLALVSDLITNAIDRYGINIVVFDCCAITNSYTAAAAMLSSTVFLIGEDGEHLEISATGFFKNPMDIRSYYKNFDSNKIVFVLNKVNNVNSFSKMFEKKPDFIIMNKESIPMTGDDNSIHIEAFRKLVVDNGIYLLIKSVFKFNQFTNLSRPMDAGIFSLTSLESGSHLMSENVELKYNTFIDNPSCIKLSKKYRLIQSSAQLLLSIGLLSVILCGLLFFYLPFTINFFGEILLFLSIIFILVAISLFIYLKKINQFIEKFSNIDPLARFATFCNFLSKDTDRGFIKNLYSYI